MPLVYEHQWYNKTYNFIALYVLSIKYVKILGDPMSKTGKTQQFILKLLPRAVDNNAQVIFDPEVQVLFKLVD